MEKPTPRIRPSRERPRSRHSLLCFPNRSVKVPMPAEWEEEDVHGVKWPQHFCEPIQSLLSIQGQCVMRSYTLKMFFCFFWIWLDKIIAAGAVSTRAWVLTSRDKLSHSRLKSQLHRQVIVRSGKGRMSRCGHLGRGVKRFGDTLRMTGSLGFFRRQEANVTKQAWSIRVWPGSLLTCPWRGSNCEISSWGTNSSSG